MDWQDRILGGFVVFVVVLVVLVVSVVLPLSLRADAICVEHGWPSGILTWKLEAYCMREVNETEYVLPLERVRAGEKPWRSSQTVQ